MPYLLVIRCFYGFILENLCNVRHEYSSIPVVCYMPPVINTGNLMEGGRSEGGNMKGGNMKGGGGREVRGGNIKRRRQQTNY